MDCLFADISRYDYSKALELQERLVELRQADRIPDTLLLVEHGHTYTVGRRANASQLLWTKTDLKRRGIEFFRVDRGGEITYHGPGQLVGYPIVKIGGISRIREYLNRLEEVLIRTAADFVVSTERLPGLTGVWLGSEKLAAIGLRVTRGVTKHGFALNVSTDLSYFDGIIPCGLADKGTTSLSEILGTRIAMSDVKASIVKNFGIVFSVDITAIKMDELIKMAGLERVIA
ncbi:MAG: lipoyl(octanoyl) transferase LipB [Candidatus Aquicultor sp.]|nr:lipoyl(octanoyl) transferase LipB [Candidatus Aquicultor sp.]